MLFCQFFLLSVVLRDYVDVLGIVVGFLNLDDILCEYYCYFVVLRYYVIVLRDYVVLFRQDDMLLIPVVILSVYCCFK